MADRKSYDPSLFESAAPYYRRFRGDYPEPMFEFLVKDFALGPDTRVLDLGCGPGQIAIPFARRGVPVMAMDPQAEMLEEGRDWASEEGVTGIEWRLGSSWDLSPELGLFRLVTIGRAFHWMDRLATLRALDANVEPGGGVALIAELHKHDPLIDTFGRARDAIREVIEQFLGPERRAGSGFYGRHVDRHEDMLARSAFCEVQFHTFPADRRWNVDELIGLAYSHSGSTPALLGEHREEFERLAPERLLAMNPSGVFEETTSIEVVTGRRPR